MEILDHTGEGAKWTATTCCDKYYQDTCHVVRCEINIEVGERIGLLVLRISYIYNFYPRGCTAVQWFIILFYSYFLLSSWSPSLTDFVELRKTRLNIVAPAVRRILWGISKIYASAHLLLRLIKGIINELLLYGLLSVWRLWIDHCNSLLQSVASRMSLSEGKHFIQVALDSKCCFWLSDDAPGFVPFKKKLSYQYTLWSCKKYANINHIFILPYTRWNVASLFSDWRWYWYLQTTICFPCTLHREFRDLISGFWHC